VCLSAPFWAKLAGYETHRKPFEVAEMREGQHRQHVTGVSLSFQFRCFVPANSKPSTFLNGPMRPFATCAEREPMRSLICASADIGSRACFCVMDIVIMARVPGQTRICRKGPRPRQTTPPKPRFSKRCAKERSASSWVALPKWGRAPTCKSRLQVHQSRHSPTARLLCARWHGVPSEARIVCRRTPPPVGSDGDRQRYGFPAERLAR
jgi:hypothetical protein